MHFGNSAGNFGGSAVRRPVGHGSAAAMSKLVALLPNYIQIVQNWAEKGVKRRWKPTASPFWTSNTENYVYREMGLRKNAATGSDFKLGPIFL